MRSPFRSRRRPARAVLALAAALPATVLPAAVLAPPASAEPLPTFSFAKCPALPAGADPSFWNCNVAVINGGQFTFGRFDQRLTSPITITYAVGFDPETLEQKVRVGGFEAAKMLVKPGIFGDPILTAVYAQPEYAGAMDLRDGDVLLNLKVNVSNPVLGRSCSIGSDAAPVKLRLTFGKTSPPPPNKPISGSYPVDVSTDPPVFKATMVDNSFAVPSAHGCGLAGALNWAVDLQAALPSAAGKNTAIFSEYVGYRPYTKIPPRPAGARGSTP
ncbi:hypothetical protein AGRA3207_005623 [Actinomadura graeca]|uniref:Secreted protein n=1 Tax=Actinomadura graeca TaxID=2750812 RepID=A0ABX8R5R0_9ACTN|nr:hypothetical protein [Actinomadura graeca]QXJ24323.1 hypothetical protein AGRA3207_005623 [Actinomadura graeca]